MESDVFLGVFGGSKHCPVRYALVLFSAAPVKSLVAETHAANDDDADRQLHENPIQ